MNRAARLVGTVSVALTLSVPLVLALCAATASAQEQEVDLGALLAEAVDRPTGQLRRQSADELAARDDIPLERWTEACARFGKFAPQEPGVRREQALIAVGGVVETTTIDVFVSTKYDPAVPAPLLLAFHGTGMGGDYEPERWRAVAEPMGMIVVSPSETGANDGYRFSRAERDAAQAAVRWARRKFNVDENRVHATGISRGGHLVWDVALRFPDQFATLAPMIGGPRINLTQGQNNLRYVDHLAHVPIRDLQGAKDDALMILNLEVAFKRLEKAGATDAKLILFPEMGHGFDIDAVDWTAFWKDARRDPVPKRVLRLAARSDEARSFWVEVESFDKGVREDFPLQVDPQVWNRLDDEGKRRQVMAITDRKTARLEAEWTGPGEFQITTDEVKKVRLLLSEAMLPAEGAVVVKLDNKTKRKPAPRSARVLLREFVERFDRTFLPVAEVVVP